MRILQQSLPSHFLYRSIRRGRSAALCILATSLGACARGRTSNPPAAELWVPADAEEHFDLEGRELWLDVELSGYTRQSLERYSDYEALQGDPRPDKRKSIPAPSPKDPN